jgi:ketosteroid isomerase-like protein
VSEDPRVKLIREGFEAWERGDVEETLALYDPEIEVYAPPEIGNPGTFHGIEGFLEWSQVWMEAWESFRQELVAIDTVGDSHALARVKQTAEGKGSGVAVERQATWVYDIRDDKLRFMAVFFDHEKAVALARQREAAD